ncbi:hypothetical protein ACLMJK_006253 [Lecanora helva]
MSLPRSSPRPHHSPHQTHPPPSLLPSALPETTTPAANPQPQDDTAIDPSLDNETGNTDPTPPPPHISPFFTLISRTNSPTTYHPTVHYIFSDDTPENDPITAAALQILDPASTSSTPTSPSNNKPPSPETSSAKDRYILLDLDATGTQILSAQSMSPDWAVTSTEVTAAPTWDDSTGGEEGQEGGGGMMLRIEGMEVPGVVGGEGEEEKGLEELVEVWERRMGELRRVVDAGVGVARKGED